jgi:AcrR family transcriptional regulator
MAEKSVQLLWGPPARPSRGPKPALSLEQIVSTAVAIADAEGLGAVSMQRVATELGFTTMSLYRYVPGKNELLDLMMDSVVGEPPALQEIPGGWRPKLERWAHLTYAAFHAHPWFLTAATRRRVMGPNEVGWLEVAVRALAGTRLKGDELVDAVLTVNGHVRSLAVFTVQEPVFDEQAIGTFVDLLRQNASRFPALNAALADGAFGPSQAHPIDFGLQRILDGIEAYIEFKH